MKRWILFLLIPLWTLLMQSCQKQDCIDKGTCVSYAHVTVTHDSGNSASDTGDKMISAIPLNYMLYSPVENHFRLGNLFQRSLQQLVQQWNRETMKASGRYMQCRHALSVMQNGVAFLIGRCSIRPLYLYHIRRLII